MKKLLGLMFVAVLALAGCGSSSDGNVLRLPTLEVEGLDVTQATYSQTSEMMAGVYEGLYVGAGEGITEPAGALGDPEISEDGLTYTFKLNDKNSWVDSNGEIMEPVTANDYVYAWQRMVNPESAAQYAYIFEVVAGYEDAIAGNVEQLGVKAVDDYTLEVKLAYPAPYFQSMMAFNAFNPINKTIAEQSGEAYGTTADSVWYNGPFYITEFDKTGTIKMVKNENYWDAARVELDGVELVFIKDSATEFASYEAGEIDKAKIPSPEQYKISQEKYNDQISFASQAGTMGFYYNTESELTGDQNLRKALSAAINAEEIANEIYGAGTQVARTFVPAELTESSYGKKFSEYNGGELAKYDPAAAKEYMAKAEESLGMKASDINVRLLVASNDTNKALAEYLQSQFASTLGIQVTIDQGDQSAYSTKRNSGDFDMVYGGWSADYADAGNFLGLFQSNFVDGLNTSRYTNEAYDEAFQVANKEQDPESRNEQFAALEKQIIEEEANFTPVIIRGSSRLVNPKYEIPTDAVNKVSYKFYTVNE
jgi:oligopeptide transport system substrate-binding protein